MRLLTVALQHEHDVVLARQRARQVAELRDFRPQAIILDIMLQGEDAWSLLAELKGQQATQDIPIVVVTMNTDEQKGLALGANAYYVKPLERVRLLETLRYLTPVN
jgi:DNA-binding response OmpR family regulator